MGGVCGMCVKTLPDIFEMNNKKANVIKLIYKKDKEKAIEDEKEEIKKVIEKCPTKAINYK